MAQTSRKSISKTDRFEIFKRDKFSCQYCGRTPPSVKLEVDHIIPVAEGGENKEQNLISACEDCNAGKGARPLSHVPLLLEEQIAEQQERRAQVEAYNKFLMSARRKDEKILEKIGYYWFNKFKTEQNHYVFGDGRIPSIKTFLKHLTPAEILDAIDIAYSRLSVNRGCSSDFKTWKYFCGVCWHKIRIKSGPDTPSQTRILS